MTVRDTSINVYSEIIKEGVVGKKQIEVLKYLHDHRNITDKELSVGSGININCVNGRRNELVDYGLVESNGKRKCSITDRTVYQWGLKDVILPLGDIINNNKKKRIKGSVCGGKGYIDVGQQTLR